MERSHPEGLVPRSSPDEITGFMVLSRGGDVLARVRGSCAFSVGGARFLCDLAGHPCWRPAEGCLASHALRCVTVRLCGLEDFIHP